MMMHQMKRQRDDRYRDPHYHHHRMMDDKPGN